MQVEKWLVENQDKLGNESTDRLAWYESNYVCQSREKVQGTVLEVLGSGGEDNLDRASLAWMKLTVQIIDMSITMQTKSK